MSDLWRWQCKGPGCRACFNAEGAIGGATCQYCGNVGRRVMRIPDQPAAEFHDDKPSETACNMAVQTQPGDLDTFGRPMRQGS